MDKAWLLPLFRRWFPPSPLVAFLFLFTFLGLFLFSFTWPKISKAFRIGLSYFTTSINTAWCFYSIINGPLPKLHIFKVIYLPQIHLSNTYKFTQTILTKKTFIINLLVLKVSWRMNSNKQVTKIKKYFFLCKSKLWR